MFSKILVKLIDQAIVPAVLLLSTRVISVLFLSKNFNVNFFIGTSGFVFTNPADYVKINSYSTLFMIAVLSVGLLYILLKSYIFHETHITPGLTAKLFSLKLSYFVQASFDLYSQGAVWLSYTYLLTIIAGLMGAFNLLYMWVFYTGLVLSIISTVLLIADVENEMGAIKPASFEAEVLAEEDTDAIK